MNLKLTVEQIAKVCHEVNRAYSEAIGDPVKPTWEECPEDQRVSCRAGVELHLGNPTTTPSESHGSWLQNKLATGWKYGEKFDQIFQTHPAMVPYEQLPKEQRAKDYIFRAIVMALAATEFKGMVLMAPNEAGKYNPIIVQEEPFKIQGELIKVAGVADPDTIVSSLDSVAEKMANLVGDTVINPNEPITGPVDLEGEK